MHNERKKYILEQLKQVGQVQIVDLFKLFGVTSQTIRRDLADLCEQGLAIRTHGGARRAVITSTVQYDKRRQLEINAKKKIAHQAANLIPNGSSVSINIGTTTEKVAEEIKYHKDLIVITNNINVVHILRSSLVKSLVIVGGEVRPSDGAIVGSEAIECFNNYKVDMAIIGASSLDADGSILDFDQREVAVARAILSNARTRILVCDCSKFSVSATHRICHVSDLDYVCMDSTPPSTFVEMAKKGATQLILTNEM